MVKFKVLKYNEFSLVHLGMFSKRVEEKPPSFFQLFRIWPSLAISGTFCILGSMYAYQHSSQFTLALRTWNLTSGAAQALCAFICFGLNSTKIQAVHQKLQDLVDKTAPEGKNFHNHHLNLSWRIKVSVFYPPLPKVTKMVSAVHPPCTGKRNWNADDWRWALWSTAAFKWAHFYRFWSLPFWIFSMVNLTDQHMIFHWIWLFPSA